MPVTVPWRAPSTGKWHFDQHARHSVGGRGAMQVHRGHRIGEVGPGDDVIDPVGRAREVSDPLSGRECRRWADELAQQEGEVVVSCRRNNDEA